MIRPRAPGDNEARAGADVDRLVEDRAALSGSVLGHLTWTEVAARAAATIVVIPVGSTEQHGPHLPLSTDTDIAVTLATRLAGARSDMVVAPAIAYGASGEHAGFAGTLSIGQEALELVLLELGRSADAFAGTVFVSAHGGNAGPLSRAVGRLRAESRAVLAWSPPGGPAGGDDPSDQAGHRDRSRGGDANGRVGRGDRDVSDGTRGGAAAARPPDAHAGWTETSVVLALNPELVRMSQAEAGATAPLNQLMPTLLRRGVAGVSANGVLGDPAGASGAKGRRLLDDWSKDLIATLDGWP